MKKHQTVIQNRTGRNAGFSLVELIIVVSILAIAAIPLMKSMSMSSRVNARAQSIQNATSVGEQVMEEMKSSSIDTLKTRYGSAFADKGTYYEISIPDRVATQGEKFDIKVKIDKGSYSSGDETSEPEKVKAANKMKLPAIEEIDTLAQAVLSSKELNRYDLEAQSYFNQRKADYDSSSSATVAVIESKTIDIKKSSPMTDSIKVEVTVTYKDSAGNTYVRDLYTGSFVPQDSTGELDSNIYIFYKPATISPLPETTINIKDEASVSAPKTPLDSHRVYFIKQLSTDELNKLTITFNSPTEKFTKANLSALTDGDKKYDGGKIEFITNLNEGGFDKKGHIYKEEARIRVYDVTVSIFNKSGDPVTELNSTVSASDEITPVPAPGP